MAKYNVPGIKDSKGMKGFPIFTTGDYKLKCVKAEVKEPKNPQPMDDWTFTWDVLSGGPTRDGESSVGKRFVNRINILHEEHPDYDSRAQMGVDELKSLIVAAGVQFRKEDIEIEAFVGTEVTARIVESPDKNDPSKIYNNVRGWKSA